MSCVHFEEEPVWRMALDLAVRTYSLTENLGFGGAGGFGHQLETAVVTASSKIAEGFEQVNRQDIQECQSAARAAVAKVRSILYLVERLPAFGKVRQEVSELNGMALELGQRLTESIDSLAAHGSGHEGVSSDPSSEGSHSSGSRSNRRHGRTPGHGPLNSDEFLKQLSQVQVLGGHLAT